MREREFTSGPSAKVERSKGERNFNTTENHCMKNHPCLNSAVLTRSNFITLGQERAFETSFGQRGSQKVFFWPTRDALFVVILNGQFKAQFHGLLLLFLRENPALSAKSRIPTCLPPFE